jgi:transposase-like protein
MSSMKEQMLDRFSFPKKLKEELVGLVLYKGMDAKVVADKYGLPNVHILSNWIKFYKKKLEAGAITLAPMEKKGKVKTVVLRQRIKQLEKSLEKANVMIYGLNAMIDYAEKELKVPVRKKRGTKQSS